MKTLGIIGAENSHSHAIARLCNIDKAVPLRATHIWGETKAFAETAAERGGIATIVEDWKSLAGCVDGIMIDHRHGRDHTEPARYFLSKGIPTFVDKPITTNLAEAKQLFRLAEKNNAPLITFSAIPQQEAFRKFAKALGKQGPVRAVNSTGPADLESKYGGIFFYGIHQADALADLAGCDAKTACLQRCGENGVATVCYPEGRVATMNLIRQGGVFHWQVCCENQVFNLANEPDGKMYLSGLKAIHRLIAKGEVACSRERMLAPIALLEAMEKSLASGRPEKVGKL